MMGIYILINKETKNRYIGMSNNIPRRFMEHRAPSRLKQKGLVLYRALKKHGVKKFMFSILEVVDNVNDLPERERYWIDLLKPEYNMNDGGLGNSAPLSEEVKELLRVKGKEQWEAMDQEQRNGRIKNNLKGPRVGHSVSESTREKLRQHNLGKKQSQETIRKRADKIKVSMRGNKNGNKPVTRIEDGRVYQSVKAAADDVGIHSTGITTVLKGRQNTAGGYTWKYYNS